MQALCKIAVQRYTHLSCSSSTQLLNKRPHLAPMLSLNITNVGTVASSNKHVSAAQQASEVNPFAINNIVGCGEDLVYCQCMY